MSSHFSKLKLISISEVTKNENSIIDIEQERISQKIIYPELPSYHVVENAKLETESKIKRLQNKLLLAEREKNMIINRKNNILKYFHLNVDEFRSNLYPIYNIKTLEEQNFEKQKKANQRYTLSDKSSFNLLQDLNQYTQNLKTQEENIALFYTSLYWYKSLNMEREIEAAKYYSSISNVWKQKYNLAVDTINLKYHRDSNYWGKEQITTPTVPFEGDEACLGTAPNVKMNFKNELTPICNFVNDNHLVSDPIEEHNSYKDRNHWSKEEKQLFISVFWKTPHKFKEIAKHFPGKTTKDMIEFYYLSKDIIYKKRPKNIFARKQK